MTDMDKMMIEKVANAIGAALATQAGMLFSERNARIAAQAALAAYNPDDRLREALDELQKAERHFRLMMFKHGGGSNEAERAYKVMKRAGDQARSALSPLPQGDGFTEKVAQVIEDRLFPIFGAGPYEDTARLVVEAMSPVTNEYPADAQPYSGEVNRG